MLKISTKTTDHKTMFASFLSNSNSLTNEKTNQREVVERMVHKIKG